MHCLPCVFSGKSNRSTLSMKLSKWSQLASELNPTMVKFHSKFIQNEHVWMQGRLCFSVWYFCFCSCWRWIQTYTTAIQHRRQSITHQHQQRPLVSLGRYFFGCFDKTRGNTVVTRYFFIDIGLLDLPDEIVLKILQYLPLSSVIHSLSRDMLANIPAIPYCCVMETFYITGYRASSFLHEA